MTGTSTLPKSLLEEMRSRCNGGSEEWLDDSELLDLLREDFKDVSIAAPTAIVERALAYSASHRVRPSGVMENGHIEFLN